MSSTNTRDEFQKWYEGKKVFEETGYSIDQTHVLSIADWWLSKLSSHTQEVIKRIEDMPTPIVGNLGDGNEGFIRKSDVINVLKENEI